MRTDEVLFWYDDNYAKAYDERFLTCEWRRPHTDFEEEVLRSLIPQGGRWLDVACGSGYFLSRFPDVERAGFDLAPGMLRHAERRNPGASFYQGSFLDLRPEWADRWDVVSCMGSAYVVVETLSQIRTLVGNLAAWTSPSGGCFLPMTPCDGFQGAKIPYETTALHPGRIIITGVTWTYLEASGEEHHDLIAPQEQFLIDEFSKYFTHVESVVYPRLKPEWEPTQRGIVARYKRQTTDASAA